MKAPQTALLLVGSPKLGASSSESLGVYLVEELEKRGLASQTTYLPKALRGEEATEDLLDAVASTDIVVLSFPLYVDSLPAPTILALELIAAGRAAEADEGRPDAHRPAFVAICQSGFPEVEHSEVAIEICRNFSDRARFEWAGGLILAAGGMISGQPLRKVASRLRSAVRALDLSAEALAAGRPVPDEAVRLMAKPPVPPVAYRFMANFGWRRDLKRRGAGEPLDARPYV
jgi:hypothetical protein